MKSSFAPEASLEALIGRAQLLRQIREFFYLREVLEVETPLLCQTAATDPFIQSMPVELSKTYYLQTSPEFAMKRMLAANDVSIYQICKAFRYEEMGRQHNPEFTILEWYRVGFDHHQLMDEMDALLQTTLHSLPATKITYLELFQSHLGFNPHLVSLKQLEETAEKLDIRVDKTALDRDDWLMLLMSHVIEPKLGYTAPVMIYDFPESQAALARIRDADEGEFGEYKVAERFEVYVHGVELANGYHELTQANEQWSRFKQDCDRREALGLPQRPIDYRLLAALEHGLPACAGVALGVDRLLMLKLNKRDIKDILSFTFETA